MTEFDQVQYREIPLSGDAVIGVACINAPKKLNAINIAIVQSLYSQLLRWKADDAVVSVVLHGAGEKAFCAGGDVVSIHHAATAYGEESLGREGHQFFEQEYRLDYLIHNYNKPFVVWGSGIVMGGGLGLLAGASHRVVTNTTRMAMPEISIGLFPDVGATWFLNRAPASVGQFIGTTGVMMNAADTITAGLGNFFVGELVFNDFLDALSDLSLSGDIENDHALMTERLQDYQSQQQNHLPHNNILENNEYILSLTGSEPLEMIQAICHYDGENIWLQSAAKKLKLGCPVTAFVVDEQLKRGKDMSLKEVFKLELILATNALKLGHFKEGVRALLIDKDNSPAWSPSTFDDVTKAHIGAHFEFPWQGAHPLDDL